MKSPELDWEDVTDLFCFLMPLDTYSIYIYIFMEDWNSILLSYFFIRPENYI